MKPKGKNNNYKENIRTVIHQKYIKKLEDQEKLTIQRIRDVEIDYTKQVEELQEMLANMAIAVTEAHNESVLKIRDLFDIVVEKDIKIQELEQIIESYEDENRRNEADPEAYSLKTELNAIKTNMRRNDKYIAELEKTNKELTIKVAKLTADTSNGDDTTNNDNTKNQFYKRKCSEVEKINTALKNKISIFSKYLKGVGIEIEDLKNA